ncbi:hypothetical protein FANTH_8317 [Fusarium anthophilum]|uniref:Uncharacterized protein n=1 Tax=Fusarium anthophilum TaxID=48485 RepID=A0A8H5E0Z8_9HYPO|nr:hypothetical protein FANTH_8317 [Fusarium anthophilum]
MASPSTLMTVISPTTTLDVPAQHYDSKPTHSDKIVIIGLTVAHRQQKKEQNKEASLRGLAAGRRNASSMNGRVEAQV